MDPDFSGLPPHQALLSQDWFGGMGVLDFLRSVGKHARVNTMMSRESVKQRLARDEGISFTEYVPPSRPSHSLAQQLNHLLVSGMTSFHSSPSLRMCSRVGPLTHTHYH